MAYNRSLLAAVLVLSALTPVGAQDRSTMADAPLRRMGIDLFGWVKTIEVLVGKLLQYGGASAKAMQRQDLSAIALLLQEIAANKRALAKRLGSPELWTRGPSGEPSYRGSEIANVVDLLNRLNRVGRRLDPTWQVNNFELTGGMKAALADKFVLVDQVHGIAVADGKARGNIMKIDPHIAVIEGGAPTHLSKASELAALCREEAARLDVLARQIRDVVASSK